MAGSEEKIKRVLMYYGREEINQRLDRFKISKDGPRGAAGADDECHLSGNYGNPDSFDDFGRSR
jgi:hypothetical protein